MRGWAATHPDFPLRIVEHRGNMGTATAINTGSALASGEFWTWVSGDNDMGPSWLTYLVHEMKGNVGAAWSSYWRAEHDPETGKDSTPVLFQVENIPPEGLISVEACYYGPSFLIRADVWRSAGPHRGRTSHDYDHWLRVEEACWRGNWAIRQVLRPLCLYRVHNLRQCVTRHAQYDAPHWREEAIRRRAALSTAKGVGIE
jgi:hypothetical protein